MEAYNQRIEARIDSIVTGFDNRVFTPKEVANLISGKDDKPISIHIVRRWLDEGKLEYTDKGKSYYVSGSQIKAFCSQSKKYNTIRKEI